MQPGFAPEIVDFQTSPAIESGFLYMTSQDSLHFFGTVIDDDFLAQVTLDLRSTTDERIQLLTYNINSDSLPTFDLSLNTDTILPQYETNFPGLLLVKYWIVMAIKRAWKCRLNLPLDIFDGIYFEHESFFRAFDVYIICCSWFQLMY